MTPDEIARLGDVKLVPGMPVETFIQTGERTVLSYLIKPLHDQLMRSFREKFVPPTSGTGDVCGRSAEGASRARSRR